MSTAVDASNAKATGGSMETDEFFFVDAFFPFMPFSRIPSRRQSRLIVGPGAHTDADTIV
jgi:hypothetical protein